MATEYAVYEQRGNDLTKVGQVEQPDYPSALEKATTEYGEGVKVELDLQEYEDGKHASGVYYDHFEQEFVTFHQESHGDPIIHQKPGTDKTVDNVEWQVWLYDITLGDNYTKVSEKALTDPASVFLELVTEHGEAGIPHDKQIDYEWAKKNTTVEPIPDYQSTK